MLELPGQATLGSPVKLERPRIAGRWSSLRMPGFVDQKLLLGAQADETRRVTLGPEAQPR